MMLRGRSRKKRNYDDGVDGVGGDVYDSCDCAIISQQYNICIKKILTTTSSLSYRLSSTSSS